MSAGQPQAPEEAAIQTQLLEKGRENIHPAVSRLIRFTDEVELGGPNTAADPKTSAKYWFKKKKNHFFIQMRTSSEWVQEKSL